MTIDEAKRIMRNYEIEFEIEDSSFGDGSCKIQYKYLMDSKPEATQFIQALSILLKP